MSTVVCAKLASLGPMRLAAALTKFALCHQDVARWVVEAVASTPDPDPDDEDLLRKQGRKQDREQRSFASNLVLLFKKKPWCVDNMLHLVAAGRIDQANHCTLVQRDEVDGSDHRRMAVLAAAFGNGAYPLAATVVYRVMLTDILHGADEDDYAKGCDFLINLKVLASGISHWQGLDDHETFAKRLRTQHRGKLAFWKTYWRKLGINVEDGGLLA